MIKPLSNWAYLDSKFAFSDTESATAIEQTAKVYRKIQELIEDYNKNVEQINKLIADFTEGINKDQEEFIKSINKIMHDYIHSIDTKIDLQNKEVNDAVNYMKTNLSTSISEIVSEMKTNGELDVAIANGFDNLGTRVEVLENTEYTLVYEPGTENLILQKSVKEGE